MMISRINNGTLRKCDESPENGRETFYEEKLIGLIPAATAESFGITTADLSNTCVYLSGAPSVWEMPQATT
jgi:hypothetical protein